eukprot:8164221-Pyramimonas_sp.AAC.1
MAGSQIDGVRWPGVFSPVGLPLWRLPLVAPPEASESERGGEEAAGGRDGKDLPGRGAGAVGDAVP